MKSEPDEQQEALTALRRAIALWYVRQGSAADVVLTACDLLVIGVDGPTLMELAAVQLSCAEVDVDPLLEATLLELGQPELAPETVAADRTALVAMAHRALSGAISPRHLTSWVYPQFGHEGLDEAKYFAHLDADYDANWFATAEIDANVLAEARKLLTSDENTPGPI